MYLLQTFSFGTKGEIYFLCIQKSFFRRYEISYVYRRAIGHSPPNRYLQVYFYTCINSDSAILVLKVDFFFNTLFTGWFWYCWRSNCIDWGRGHKGSLLVHNSTIIFLVNPSATASSSSPVPHNFNPPWKTYITFKWTLSIEERRDYGESELCRLVLSKTVPLIWSWCTAGRLCIYLFCLPGFLCLRNLDRGELSKLKHMLTINVVKVFQRTHHMPTMSHMKTKEKQI